MPRCCAAAATRTAGPTRRRTAPGCAARARHALDAAAARDAAGHRGDPRARVAATSSPTSSCSSRPRCEATGVGRRSASRCRSAVRSDDDEEPLARAEPVEIDLGGGLTFRIAGRIDRIDKVGAGDVRGARLQDRRLLARRLEGHVQRRPSSAARAVRAGGGRAAAAHATRSRRSPAASTTSRATRDGSERVRDPGAVAARRSRRCSADLRERDRRRARSSTPPTRTAAGSATTRPRAASDVHEQAEAKLADAKLDGVREARGA